MEMVRRSLSCIDTRPAADAHPRLFIIEGVMTITVASICFFILPDFPSTTTWLTDQERALAIWRLRKDIGVDDLTDSKADGFFHGMILAFKDIKVWILMLMLFGIVSAASVTNFFPTVVQTLGYSKTHSLLLTAPPYILAVFTAVANALHADRTGERFLHISLPLLVGIFAFILAAATTSVAPRYVAMMLMVPGVYSSFVIGLAWISNTIPRPPAKRAATLAAINAVSNASNIYTSYMYLGGPRYIVAFSVNCATLLMSIGMAAVLRTILLRLNQQLDRGEEVEGAIREADTGEGEAMRKGFRFLT